MPEKTAQPARGKPAHIRGRRWKRPVILALLLLAGGSVVNVAVAWGCALWVGFDPMSHFQSPAGGVLEEEDDYHHWLVIRYQNVAACRFASQWADRDLTISMPSGSWPADRPEALIPDWARFVRPPVEAESQATWHYRWIDARGWPVLTLWTGIACDTTTHVNSESVQVLGGIALGSPNLGLMRTGNEQRFIPLRPIPPGFIINTLFYALLLWLLFFAPFAARRMLRRRRGQCEKCAYPIGVSPVCTECGAAVTRKAQA